MIENRIKRIVSIYIAIIFCAVIFVLCVGRPNALAGERPYVQDASASGNAVSDTQDYAELGSIVEETSLVMDSKSFVFSNSTDGMFRLTFAEKRSYFIASAEDPDTLITYALIKYNSKFYLVVADDSDDNAEYNGSYTDTSFDMLESMVYDSSKRTVAIKMEPSEKISLFQFTYNKDYSVNISGLYGDTYYENGVAATGICASGDYYNYYVSGKLVFADGWYKYGSASQTGELTEDDIRKCISINSIKYVQLFEGHIVSVYFGEFFYSYSGRTSSMVKGRSVSVNNIKVLFNSKGHAYSGLRKTTTGIYFYEAGVTNKNSLEKVGNDYYYFGEDGKAVSKVWVDFKTYVFYFSDKNIATKVYYTEEFEDSSYAGRLYSLKNGTWKSSGKGLLNVNGTFIYFVNGKKYTGTKWYVKSPLVRYYIEKGTVKYGVKPDGIRYRAYVPTTGGKWSVAKNIWLPAYNSISMHIDSKGLSDILYYKKSHPVSAYADTYRVYNNNCWIKQKNIVVYIPGGYYYIDPAGKLSRSSGWKTINSTSAVYVSENVNVTQYVYYDATQKTTIYKSGAKLTSTSEGLKRAVINKKSVYYYSSANGVCLRSQEKTVDGVVYKFDAYGRCFKVDQLGWDYDAWMKRVTRAYLGKTGIYCNVFVANALKYAGGSDPTVDMTLKYTSFASGGLLVNSGNSCSYWAEKEVTATGIVASNGAWGAKTEFELTKDRESFSYDALIPGDVIVYYTDGEPTHVGIFLGKFASAKAVKDYLKGFGISAATCDAHVHDWGSDSGNKPEYWIIQGGMGASDQVYISNSAYDLSGQYAKKIVHIRH